MCQQFRFVVTIRSNQTKISVYQKNVSMVKYLFFYWYKKESMKKMLQNNSLPSSPQSLMDWLSGPWEASMLGMHVLHGTMSDNVTQEAEAAAPGWALVQWECPEHEDTAWRAHLPVRWVHPLSPVHWQECEQGPRVGWWSRRIWAHLLRGLQNYKSLLNNHGQENAGSQQQQQKKDTLHPRAKEKPQHNGTRGKIMFRNKPHSCQRHSEGSNKTLGTLGLMEASGTWL